MWASLRTLLQRLGFRFREAVTIIDPDFGPIRFKDTFAQMQMSWAGGTVNACFYADPSSGPPFAELEPARRLVERSEEWDRCARLVAVQDMLQYINDEWLAEEEPLDAVQLAALMTPEVIWVTSDDFQVFYECGDLLGGHAIRVDGPAGGPVSATME